MGRRKERELSMSIEELRAIDTSSREPLSCGSRIGKGVDREPEGCEQDYAHGAEKLQGPLAVDRMMQRETRMLFRGLLALAQ